MAGLSDAQPNNFLGALTSEQEAQLKKESISTELPLLMELLLGGGIGGGVGRAVGRGVGHVGDAVGGMMFPGLDAMARMAGHNPSGLINWAGRAGGAAGTAFGIGGAANMANERARRNTMLDAEGQHGGFYGPASAMDAEGQPGGFYGRRR